jgi:hypothetical protein
MVSNISHSGIWITRIACIKTVKAKVSCGVAPSINAWAGLGLTCRCIAQVVRVPWPKNKQRVGIDVRAVQVECAVVFNICVARAVTVVAGAKGCSWRCCCVLLLWLC